MIYAYEDKIECDTNDTGRKGNQLLFILCWSFIGMNTLRIICHAFGWFKVKAFTNFVIGLADIGGGIYMYIFASGYRYVPKPCIQQPTVRMITAWGVVHILFCFGKILYVSIAAEDNYVQPQGFFESDDDGDD